MYVVSLNFLTKCTKIF